MAGEVVDSKVLDKVREDVKKCFPGWCDPQFMAVKRLTGGYSNIIFLVVREAASALSVSDSASKGPDSMVVRVIGAGGSKLVDRDVEVRLCKRMGTFGYCPEVFGVFDGGYITSFVPGTSLDRAGCLVHRDDTAKTLARWHAVDCTETLGKPTMMLWTRIRKWLDVLRGIPRSDKHDWPVIASSFDAELKPLEEHLQSVQEKLVGSVLPPVVACHNDVNPTNIMADDTDPKNGVPRNPEKPVVFIDLEYSFYNNPLFDIAHHFLDMGGMELDVTLIPDAAWQRAFMRTYLTQWSQDHSDTAKEFNEDTISNILKAVEHWELIVHFFWAVWAMATAALAEQERSKTHEQPAEDDFDPYDFGQLRLDRHLAARVDLGLPPTNLRMYSHDPDEWPAK